ncbi:MAG: HAD-IIIA family hydrolase [Candidatus Binataceae bacterium]
MANPNGNQGLFLDLAGTLIRMDAARQLPIDSEGNVIMQLMPNVAETLAPLRDHLIFIVTNQAGIARGRLTMRAVEKAMVELDDALGDILTGWQICPHDENAKCKCRKPLGGMITELALMYGVDLDLSTMVGDQAVDQHAAIDAGVGKFIYASEFFGWR